MRPLLIFAVLALLFGCDALKPLPPPESRQEAGPLDLPLRQNLDAPQARTRERDPARWLGVSWPRQLRLIESGVTGPGDAPLLWYRFGLGDQSPATAVSLALDALEAAAKGDALRSVHRDPNAGRVIGQLRSGSFAASVVGEDSTTTRELRVTVEMRREPGQEPSR